MGVNVIQNVSFYDVIKSQVVTDKTYKINQANDKKYFFVVSNNASKNQIKKAVEAIFDVKVSSVNTLNRYVLSKSFRGNRSKTNVKIAHVTLESGTITFDI